MNSPVSWAGAGGRRIRACSAVLLPIVLLCCGCPYPAGTADGTDLDTTSNSSLSTATALNLSSAGDELTFRGSITGQADIDVYSLGALSTGDAVHVDIQRQTGNLDAVAALFDSGEHLVAFNDDRTPDGSDLNPQIDIVLPGDADTYYLGIIAYPGNNTTGEYQATVRVQRAAGTPQPQPQLVFLDWDGGSEITVKNVGTFNLPPFSAVDVGLSASQTDAFKDRVQQVVADRFSDFDLSVLNSDDSPEPTVAHSTVYFGGRSYEAFAISEQIDTFNKDQNDDTIIFTGSYEGAFRVSPTFEELAQAVGNTIAHEVGHLLGLVHTGDCDDLMDTSCYNDRLLTAQEFGTARLHESVFPFGWQDAQEILSWLLGLAGD